MRLLPALSAALLAATSASAATAPAADASACLKAAAHRARTTFEVTVATYPTVVDHDLSIAEINLLRPVEKRRPPFAHGRSVAEYHLRDAVQSEAERSWPGGRTCAWLGDVRVDLTPDAIRIYIPKEYPQGGCEYEHLLLHEREHERLHRAGLQDLAEKMRGVLARAEGLPGPRAPIGASTPQDAYVLLQSEVENLVLPIYDEFLRKMEDQQAALDSPEHYRRLGESCSGWKSP